MAKSLKSKSKRSFRAIKRTDPKSVFKQAEDLRLARLSSKLKASALKPRELTDREEWERKQDGYETVDEEIEQGDDRQDAKVEEDKGEGTSGMAVDGEESKEAETSADKPKISTSGPRMTRREHYRTDKRFMVRPTPKTVFAAMGEKKRTGLGRPRKRK